MQKKQLGKYQLTSNQCLKFEIARGTIYKGINLQTQQKVWILVSKIDKVNKNEKFHTEMMFYQQTKDKNVINLLDTYQTQTNIYNIFESCETNLQGFVQKYGFLSQSEAFNILKQILNFFLKFNKVHCNLTPQKIFIQQGIIRLSGFSYITQVQNKTYGIKFHSGICPEIIKDEFVNLKSDVWSLGVIFYYMLFGQYPFIGNSNEELKKDIQQRLLNNDFLRDKQSQLSQQGYDLLHGMLQYDVSRRFDWKDNMIENYEIESINLDIQYSKLIYGELNLLLQGKSNQEFNFDQKWKELQQSNSYGNQTINQNVSLFTIDEFETENGSLSFGEEFNQSFWIQFKHIIKVLHFIKNTINLLIFLPKNIDRRVQVFCLYKYIMIQLENIKWCLDTRQNFMKINDFDEYLGSIEFCAQQRIIREKIVYYENSYIQAFKDFQNTYYKSQANSQQSRLFYQLKSQSLNFNEYKAVYRQPLFFLVQDILQIIDKNQVNGIIYELDDKQKQKLIKIAYRLLYCQLANRLFPYQKNGLFDFEKLNLYMDKIDQKSLVFEIKSLIKKFFGV